MIDEKKLIDRFKQLKGTDSLANMFITDVIKEIQKQPKIDEWIPCSERLPETDKNRKYLVCGGGGAIYIAEFVCKTIDGNMSIGPWWSARGRYCPKPIAWQPLPEAYRL